MENLIATNDNVLFAFILSALMFFDKGINNDKYNVLNHHHLKIETTLFVVHCLWMSGTIPDVYGLYNALLLWSSTFLFLIWLCLCLTKVQLITNLSVVSFPRVTSGPL